MSGTPSELALEARVEDGPEEYRFRIADGVCSGEEFRTAELLVAEALWDAADSGSHREGGGASAVDSVLVLEANYGVVGVLAAPAVGRVAMTESSARAAALCEANAARNGLGDETSVSLTAGLAALQSPDDECRLSLSGVSGDQSFDAVAYAPKPYTPNDVAVQRLWDAATRLERGGHVFVAAEECSGLSRYERVLEELCESVENVAERDDVAVLCGRVPSTGERVRSAGTVSVRAFDATVAGVDVELRSVPGVFSATRLDDGTRLLAEAASVEDGDRVLDLCCGYGALGAWAAQAADCSLWLSDDDRVATACAERTLHANGVDASVVTADGVEGVKGKRFDRVLCNPPTHATDRFLAALFDDVADVLAARGEVFVVHHRDLDLRSQLRAFDRVERVASGEEHVVLRAE